MYKQAIIINSSIRMSKGKAAAQAAHAAVSAFFQSNLHIAKEWKRQGQKKIIVKSSLDGIKDAEEKCRKLKLPHALIADAGMTELEPGTITALGIGPDEEEKINRVTGSMKLLK
ncbi:MAG: peptidyl-tRNA hydrolase [Candidatus Aenigmarchaeota archaeon]|nr:peptidyl-tRNA hydrolase [Candidatus Aenigmarchaeota archaeon]